MSPPPLVQGGAVELVIWGWTGASPAADVVRVLKDLPWVKHIVSPAGTQIGSTASCVAMRKTTLAGPQGSPR